MRLHWISYEARAILRRVRICPIHHIIASVWKLNVVLLEGSAAIIDVADEQGRVVEDGGRVLSLVLSTAVPLHRRGGSALDLNSRAVHIHFAISDLVEPGPGKQSRIGRWCVRWDGEVVACGDWTTSDHTLDDIEVVTVVVRK